MWKTARNWRASVPKNRWGETTGEPSESGSRGRSPHQKNQNASRAIAGRFLFTISISPQTSRSSGLESLTDLLIPLRIRFRFRWESNLYVLIELVIASRLSISSITDERTISKSFAVGN